VTRKIKDAKRFYLSPKYNKKIMSGFNSVNSYLTWMEFFMSRSARDVYVSFAGRINMGFFRILWTLAVTLALLGNMNLAVANTAEDAEKIFNWAENSYPSIFPGHSATQSVLPWLFRFYSATGIYAGVNTDNQNVYVLGGPFGHESPTFIDALHNLLVLAESSYNDSHPMSYAKLNDTGITTCSNDTENYLPCPVSGFPGQDAEHGRDALAAAGLLQKVGGGNAGFDFTKLDANGNPLPASATEWSCVKDNHTGLIWEVKTTSGLRSMHHTYSWYNPDSITNGLSPGMQNRGNCTVANCDTHGYVQAVNAEGLCGANGWRMPAREELRSIVDYSRPDLVIDTAYFPHTPSTWFWSASTYTTTNTWRVSFSSGHDVFDGNWRSNRVRLVRGGL
jgi:hypothetical protein